MSLWNLIRENATVLLLCPALFFYICSNEINLIALNGLVLRKTCLTYFDNITCNNLKNFTNTSTFIQEKTSDQLILINITFLLPAIVSIIHFAGVADKKSNYKTPLIVSIIGSLIQTTLCLLSVNYANADSFFILFMSQFINGILASGSLGFISSCFSHLSSETPNHENTHFTKSTKYSLCEASLLLGSFIGSLSSGYLIGDKLNMNNFFLTYIVSLVLYLIVFFYVILIIYFLNLKKSSDSTQQQVKAKKSIDLKEIFNLKNELTFFKDTLTILTKKRKKNDRFYLNLLLVIYYLGASIALGLGSIPYLYLLKKPISFTQTEYGIFKAVNIFMRTFSLLVLMPFLKAKYVPNHVLFVFGIVSEVFNLGIYSLASVYSNLIWLAPVFYMFSNYFVVFVRLFASDLVEKNETGKIFGIIALLEFLVLLVSSSIWTTIYRKTVAVCPWLIFVVCIIIFLTICLPMMILFIRYLIKRLKLNNDDQRVLINEFLE